ncbi:hypothetical protein C0992_005801 [Termitomyces sp. T32_za158]|nr:hypothetical protein C0992_005801 [Termitomyces sp. T32_za158]
MWYTQQVYEEDAWLHAGPEFEGSLEDWKESPKLAQHLHAVLGPERLRELDNTATDGKGDTNNDLDSDTGHNWTSDNTKKVDNGEPSCQLDTRTLAPENEVRDER